MGFAKMQLIVPVDETEGDAALRDQASQELRLLEAMLAEAMRAKVVCGRSAVPQRFATAGWRSAADVNGGLLAAEPLIRAAHQRCQSQPGSGDYVAFACAAELADVIRRLTGRLVR